MENILQQAENLQTKLVEYRRYLHQNPETHFDLPLTFQFVKEKLIEFGYQPVQIGRCGLVAIAGKKDGGRTILLRADMDALPIREETDLPFRSTNGNMHACGHDFHTAMLLGAAKLLKENEEELQGRVKLMFQPAEESLDGARDMIEAGLLENPKVDAAMMIHVGTGFPGSVPTGTVLVLPEGIASAACDWFKITVRGKGGHGASPHMAIDPLNVISHIHIALQEILARESSPGDGTVLTVGEIHGGSIANAIPDTAYCSGTIRTFSPESRALVRKRLEEISNGIAQTFRAFAVVEYTHECPCMTNNPEVSRQVVNSIRELLGSEKLIDLKEYQGGIYAKSSGSEDFAYVSERVPSVAFNLVAGCAADGYQCSPHQPHVMYDEKALPYGTAIHVDAAMKWLRNNR